MFMRHTAMVAGLALGLMSGIAHAAPIQFDYTGNFQSYTINTSGIYNIIAFGAQGANDGGLGAEIGGRFNLAAGQTLNIAVGGQGFNGGGGGSFVTLAGITRAYDVPLVIAGGGGSSSRDYPGLTGTSGGSANQGGEGGVAGNGGAAGGVRGQPGGNGGGGFYTNGDDVFGMGQGGKSYQNGLVADGDGGFGGGGDSFYGAGGGGGYSGGGGAGNLQPGGGGGGSFLAGFALSQTVAIAGENFGNGYVTLDLVSSPVSPVPLPASAPMFGAAVLALGLSGYGLKRKKATFQA